MSAPMPVQRALGRAALYRLCAMALGYPGPGRLPAVADLAERIASTVDGPLGAQVAALARTARASDEARLAGEYVGLFDAAARCAPCEGAYGPPQMAGKAAQLADIAGFYTAFGLAPSDGQPDVEDHIATELEFMSALAVKEAWAVAEGHRDRAEITAEAAIAFFRDHLGRWAPAFATELGAASAAPYYLAVATLLRAWLDVEAGVLGVAPMPVTPRPAAPSEQEPFACPNAPPS
jgi:TorA maturation chaperone TorD